MQIGARLTRPTADCPFCTPPTTRLIEDRKVDAFSVAIRKSEQRFSPTTMYEDYGLTDRLFHWQSQSTTSPRSPTGKRHTE